MLTKTALTTIFLVSTIVSTINVAVAQDGFIAGVDPAHRPEGAPSITYVEKDKAWYANALFGVVPPYPDSLLFLDDEGNWFTPFNRPGMHGPYDIRGWHSQQ